MTNKTLNEIEKDNEVFLRYVSYSNIPPKTHETYRLFTFIPTSGKKIAYEAALKFVGQKDGESLREHHFITFGGQVGCGKTHLALGIAWHWVDNKMGLVKYYHTADLLEQMRREYDHPGYEERTSIYNQCCKVPLLILDDLGAEKGTEWAVERLDMIVDYRWLNEKPTVFTTNKLLSELPPRIASRLKEGVTVMVEGSDYRELKAKSRAK